MRKNKKEYIYNNYLNLHSLRGNRICFLRFMLLSNNSFYIQKYVYRVLFFSYLHKKLPICRISGRQRSINRYTFLSRIALRDLILNGSLLGFKKSSW